MTSEMHSWSLSALCGREHPFCAGDIAEHAVDVPEGGGGNVAQGVEAEDGNSRGHDRNRVEVMDITPKALRRSLQTHLLSGNRDLGGENCKSDV